jgi:hypothetical protein
VKVEIEDSKWPGAQFDEDEPRAEGIHLGHVIKTLMESSGLAPKRKGGFSDMELTAEIGLLWERVLSKVMAEKYASRPPQVRRDGIWMSMDGLGVDPKGKVPMVVEEYKATWKSSNSPPTDNFYYMAQVKAYCREVGTNVAIMHIFYVMGDYRGSGPLYRRVRLTFTDHELEENWQMILQCKKKMEGIK